MDSEKKALRKLPHYSREKYITAFILGFLTFILCVGPILFFEEGYFIYYGDYNLQQIPFYNLVNDAVRSGQFGWNWFTDLGTDLMTSYSFYLFGSPFFWLTVFLPRAWVSYSLPFLLAIKHGVASLTAYTYIRRFVKNKNAALIGAMLYSFSGFQLFNIFFNHFHDVTAFFPLMLIAMEENINNRRRGWFALVVGLMAAINYYFFAGQAVFLVLYFLVRVPAKDFNVTWKKFLLLLLEAVVGTGLAAFIILPSALGLLGNYRITEHNYGLNFVIYDDNTTIWRIIQTFFMPSDPPAYPILFDSDYGKWASIGGYFPLFGMVGVITYMRTMKKHWATRLTVLCIIFALIPFLNSLFQMANEYYYARWFYMPILIMAMMTARSLDQEDIDFMPAVKISAAMLVVFGIISVLPDKLSDGSYIWFTMTTHTTYFYINLAIAGFSLLITGYIFDAKKRGIRTGFPAVITTTLFCAGCLCSMIYFGAATPEDAKNYIAMSADYSDKVYENVSEDNFFRSDISDNLENYNMFWELPCIRTFQSVVSPSIMEFYDSIKVMRDVGSRPDISHYTIRGLLSVKYFYREETDEYNYQELQKKKDQSESSSDFNRKFYGNGAVTELNAAVYDITEYLPGFEYIETRDGYEIYENTLYVPMGFAYDTYMTQSTADSISKTDYEKLLMKSLLLEDSDVEKYHKMLTELTKDDIKPPTKEDYTEWCKEKQAVSCSSFSFDSHGFKAEITLDKPSLVFFSVPYSTGWSARVNNNDADIAKVSHGFMAVKCDKGTSSIVFRYQTPGFKAGTLISFISLFLLISYIALSRVTGDDTDRYPFRHSYDYESTCGVAGSLYYCSAPARKKKKKKTDDEPEETRKKWRIY
ncbi:MAG: YfhO family protein [Ruminococcus sp.]|nr:YfhO family protein [Ruminococcus sp.]